MRLFLVLSCCDAAPRLHLLLPLAPLREALALDPGLAELLLVELRLPRTLLVLGYGAVLGITGAALQALFANPLASPDITGSSQRRRAGRGARRLLARLRQPARACRVRRGWGARRVGAAGRAGRAPSRNARPCCSPGWRIALAAGAATSLVAGARPLPFRLLRRVRMADGQLRRPQPAAGRRRADPGRDLRALCCCAGPGRSTCWRWARMSPRRSAIAPRRLALRGHRPVGDRRRGLRLGVRRNRLRRADRAVFAAGD